MAKKRQGKHDEVMLIPFLDILCSLIGILILIIVVVCVAQLQKVNGRTKEDLALAQKYQSLQVQLRELQKAAPALQAKVAELERSRGALAAKQQKLDELRKRLASTAAEAGKSTQKSAELQNQIDDLKRQIEAIVKSMPPLNAEIELLKKRLAERQKKPEEKSAAVVVKPSGGGTRQNQRLFFVEAAGAGIVIYKGKTERIRVAQNSVGIDKDYNAFLKTVKDTGNASLLFLVRRDGWGSYVKAAGWAEQSMGLNTGKLPIPGDGVVDLSAFEKP